MSKKLLAILGSPRKNGNCAKMLQTLTERAVEKGYEVEFIRLYEQKIAYCAGCMACKKTGVCVVEDDLQALRKKLIETDVVALVSPTYFANVSAPVKNMFDRLVGAIMDDNESLAPKPKLSKKQGYIMMTACTTPAPFNVLAGQSTGTLRAIKEFFHISGMRCLGKAVFAGTKNKSELPKRLVKKIRALL